jgi:branched-chain amino acid transport system ATP-binding protein
LTTLKAEIPEAGYGNKVVLRNVSVSIDEGEVVALIGPNGAGKSTLLKTLMGIVSARGGAVSLDGKAIGNQSPETIVRLGMSMIPQGNRVFTELTVLENLEMGGHLLKDKAEVSRRIGSLVQLFPDLKNRLKLDAGKLSGGEKQQLALARALMLQPKILLLDEPSLGLSPKLVTKAFETIKDINQRFKTTILIVEQKVHEILRVSNRVYALRMGEIVFEGTPEQLQQGDTLKRIFLV